MKHKIITIIGNVASGKSTLTKLLTQNLQGIEVPADELFKKNPFFQLAVQDRAKWSFESDLWFLMERVKIAEKYPKLLKKNNVIIDSGLPMSWIYANSRIYKNYYNNDQWLLYKSFFEKLTINTMFPDVIVFLNSDISLLMQRIKQRNREFEVKYFTHEYLNDLQKSILEFIKIIKKKTKIITIDSVRIDMINQQKQLHNLIKKIHEK